MNAILVFLLVHTSNATVPLTVVNIPMVSVEVCEREAPRLTRLVPNYRAGSWLCLDNRHVQK